MLFTEIVLDWSDAAFGDGIPIINAYTLELPTLPAPGEYRAAFLRGHYSCRVFNGWPGVGVSPAPFSMKCYIDSTGTIYHRDTRAGRQLICRGKKALYQ